MIASSVAWFQWNQRTVRCGICSQLNKYTTVHSKLCLPTSVKLHNFLQSKEPNTKRNILTRTRMRPSDYKNSAVHYPANSFIDLGVIHLYWLISPGEAHSEQISLTHYLCTKYPISKHLLNYSRHYCAPKLNRFARDAKNVQFQILPERAPNFPGEPGIICRK